MLRAATTRPTLADEVAIVTGAGSGIGAATALELARRGATVVLAAPRIGDLQVHAHAIREVGGEAMTIPTDVADPSSATLLVERTMRAYGRVDVLVNNADPYCLATLESSSIHEIVRLVQVNFLSPMLLTHAVLPGMLHRHHGAIISVGSLSGLVAMEPLCWATKSGVRGFSLALRRQVMGSGVSVSVVSPGKTGDAMTTRVGPRLPGPDLVAAAIADLVTQPRREVEIPSRRHALTWLKGVPLRWACLTPRRRRGVPPREREGATWRS